MEHFSKTAYKGKEFYYVDYSSFGFEKDKAINLLKTAADEWSKQPLNSVLALVNLTDLRFDSSVVDAFKECKDRTTPNERKMAIIGLKGLQKIAYNFVISLTQRDVVKIFEDISEAKEWLVSD